MRDAIFRRHYEELNAGATPRAMAMFANQQMGDLDFRWAPTKFPPYSKALHVCCHLQREADLDMLMLWQVWLLRGQALPRWYSPTTQCHRGEDD
jgi:hypothetical protein